MSAIVCELHVSSNRDSAAFIVCGIATFDDGICFTALIAFCGCSMCCTAILSVYGSVKDKARVLNVVFICECRSYWGVEYHLIYTDPIALDLPFTPRQAQQRQRYPGISSSTLLACRRCSNLGVVTLHPSL
jgi:hypothetical protein